jgi:hypothetical protein
MLTRTTWLTGPNDASPGTTAPPPLTVPASTDGVAGGVMIAGGEPAGVALLPGCWVAGDSTDGGANPDGRVPAGSISSGRRAS